MVKVAGPENKLAIFRHSQPLGKGTAAIAGDVERRRSAAIAPKLPVAGRVAQIGNAPGVGNAAHAGGVLLGSEA